MDIFKDIIPSILQTKEYNFPLEEEKEYNSYIVNKSLSHHIDVLFYVNQMNLNHHIDKKMQYDYLFHSIKGYKRKYQKWIKASKDSNISLIKEYYGYSDNKARQALELLSEKDIEYIKEILDKGGKTPNNK